MIIQLSKFGKTLTSRQSGREALAAFQPTLATLSDAELVEIDFEGVNTFSPSWGDEFIGELLSRYGNRLTLRNTGNPSVMATLQMLEQVHGGKFDIVS